MFCKIAGGPYRVPSYGQPIAKTQAGLVRSAYLSRSCLMSAARPPVQDIFGAALSLGVHAPSNRPVLADEA
jgi:hypothetical protein